MRYRSWEQLAGYFDGDESVGFTAVAHIIRFELRMTDNWLPFLRRISCFLRSFGIRTWYSKRNGAWTLHISGKGDVAMTARRMYPFADKKKQELKVILDYYQDRITGNQAFARMNRFVRIGERTGKIRKATLPSRLSVGLAEASEATAESLREVAISRKLNVPLGLQRKIKKDYFTGKESQERIGKKYGYTRMVIRRVLGLTKVRHSK